MRRFYPARSVLATFLILLPLTFSLDRLASNKPTTIAKPKSSAPKKETPVVTIGTRRELFVDDLLIRKLNETRLKRHEPQRKRRVPPRPFAHYATVLKDGERLRLYYRGDKVPGAYWRNGWGKYDEGEVTLYV